jgi:hypothetical protein
MRAARFIIPASLAILIVAPAAAQQFIPRSALTTMLELHKITAIRYVDAAPDSMLGYRPTEGVRTFAEQIEHAVLGDAFIAHLAITGSDKLPSLGAADKSYLKTKAGLKAFVTAAEDHAIGMINNLSDGAMTEEVTLFGHKLPRYRALLEIWDHFPWTLGQTVPYLRLNGVTPPSYSPF